MFPSSSYPHKIANIMIDSEAMEVNMEKPFEVVFDEENPNWTTNDEHNQFFLSRYQNIFNDMLAARGYVFLNEVLDALGIERTLIGQFVGWSRSAKDDVKIEVYEAVYRTGKLTRYVIRITVGGVILNELKAK